MKNLLFSLISLTVLFACNNKGKTAEEIARARQATIDSVNEASRHQRMLDSMTAMSKMNQDMMVIESPTYQPETPASEKAKHHNTPHKGTTPPVTTREPSSPGTPSTGSSGTAASAPSPSTGTNSSGQGTVASEEKNKKGLNNAAKGAIIGLGTGAAAGAVINKDNRGKGAVIGGVVGAIGGAVGGAVLDKRKAKKEAERDSTNKK
jgi:hypothetical protein